MNHHHHEWADLSSGKCVSLDINSSVFATELDTALYESDIARPGLLKRMMRRVLPTYHDGVRIVHTIEMKQRPHRAPSGKIRRTLEQE